MRKTLVFLSMTYLPYPGKKLGPSGRGMDGPVLSGDFSVLVGGLLQSSPRFVRRLPLYWNEPPHFASKSRLTSSGADSAVDIESSG